MAGDGEALKQVLTKVFQEADQRRSGLVDLKDVEPAWKRISADPTNKADIARVHKSVEDFVRKLDKGSEKQYSLEDFLEAASTCSSSCH